MLLLAAAAWVVASQHAALDQARRSVQGAPWWLIAAALVLPLLNWLVISGSFWLMMRRLGRVAFGEMVSLIGASWLLNYLPLRAGMVGRIAYHKTVNNIPIAASLRVTVIGLIFGAVSVLFMLSVAVLLAGRAAAPAWAGVLLAPMLIAALTALILKLRGQTTWWFPAAFGLRYLDSLIWTLRYAVVFALVGLPIDLSAAVAIAAVSQVAILIPLVGNGLGLREWAVGITAAALPPVLIGGEGDMVTAIGLTADLANRAAEVLLAVPVGLTAIWLLTRRATRTASHS
jgi:hypothetical protein